MSSARSAVAAYFSGVNEKRIEPLQHLFSVTAVAINSTGELNGRDEIVAFYRNTVFPSGLVIEPVNTYLSGDSCIVELEGRVPAGDVYYMVDIFTIGSDGLVERLAVYRR